MPIDSRHEGLLILESSWRDSSLICTCLSCRFTWGMRDFIDSNHLNVIRVSYVLVHHADLLEAWWIYPTRIISTWFESHMYVFVMPIYSRNERLLRLESSRRDSSLICTCLSCRFLSRHDFEPFYLAHHADWLEAWWVTFARTKWSSSINTTQEDKQIKNISLKRDASNNHQFSWGF
jgi:hypothetical protein